MLHKQTANVFTRSQVELLQIPSAVEKMLSLLQKKRERNRHLTGDYFSKLEEFIKISKTSAGVKYIGRLFKEFKLDCFLWETDEPFLNVLMEEIKTAFDIPEHLKVFTILDPQAFPRDADLLNDFGFQGVALLSNFYGKPSFENGSSAPSKINEEALKIQFDTFKTFLFKQKIEFEMQHVHLPSQKSD